jgi:hypothetical protein
VKPEIGAHPFIGAGEGHVGARKGETAGGNGLNTIDGGRLNEGLRGGESRWGVKTLCHTRFLRPKPDAHRMYAQDQVVIHTVRM